MTFIVDCFHCKKPFDAEVAEICGCVGDKGSLECPGCRKCFCHAPAYYWKDFWAKAPQSIWDRKRATQTTPTEGKAAASAPVILVVDDHRLTRMTALRTIEKLGYRTLEATDGEMALEMVRKAKPALVLTDALMPKLDGRELCRQIKDDPALNGVRVVLMTNIYTTPSHKTEALQRYRADAFLPKPVAAESLKAVIGQLLGK